MIRSWQEALDFLYRRANWEAAPPGMGPEFKLGRVRALLARLGNPQAAWRSVHVGGTNGKGSTAVLVASGLRSAGYRVGLFTSPHMHTMRERMQVNGTFISEEAVLAWLNRHQQMLERTDGLTTFEALVALAFSHFAASQVDIAVIEVGLGGQLDATNVLANQLVSVITPIGLDHTEILGATLEAIAADKAGIFRPGIAAVIAPQAPAAEYILRQRAAALGTPLVAVGADVVWHVVRNDLAGQQLAISPAGTTQMPTYNVNARLLGHHQQANVVTAVTVLDRLNNLGFHLSPDAIGHGISTARWPGRFEVFALPSGGHLVLDGAHNPHGAAALIQALDHYFPSARRHLVLGIGGGKDAAGIVHELLPGVASVITARSEHPKALAAGIVADLVRSQLGSDLSLEAAPSLADAIRAAIARCAPGDVIVCAGSIFLVADAREAWFNYIGQPLPPHDPPAIP